MISLADLHPEQVPFATLSVVEGWRDVSKDVQPLKMYHMQNMMQKIYKLIFSSIAVASLRIFCRLSPTMVM